MARFEPFTPTTPLPKPGDHEHNALDFKGALNRRADGKPDGRELAKDVAAFANCDGGTILVGAFEDQKRGVLGTIKPLTAEDAKEAREAYSQAVRDFCRPPPISDPVVVPHGAGFVVAVNVWPFPGQAVGVRLEHEGAYVFPLRTSIDTVFLSPEQLAMLMIPSLRRTVSLLRSIQRVLRSSDDRDDNEREQSKEALQPESRSRPSRCAVRDVHWSRPLLYSFASAGMRLESSTRAPPRAVRSSTSTTSRRPDPSAAFTPCSTAVAVSTSRCAPSTAFSPATSFEAYENFM